MENLIEEYVKAVKDLKQAEAAFNYAEDFDKANRELTYARDKFKLIHKMIKESGEFAEFEESFRSKAWQNILKGIDFCDRTV